MVNWYSKAFFFAQMLLENFFLSQKPTQFFNTQHVEQNIHSEISHLWAGFNRQKSRISCIFFHIRTGCIKQACFTDLRTVFKHIASPLPAWSTGASISSIIWDEGSHFLPHLLTPRLPFLFLPHHCGEPPPSPQTRPLHAPAHVDTNTMH